MLKAVNRLRGIFHGARKIHNEKKHFVVMKILNFLSIGGIV
jgi:hypothetical protein